MTTTDVIVKDGTRHGGLLPTRARRTLRSVRSCLYREDGQRIECIIVDVSPQGAALIGALLPHPNERIVVLLPGLGHVRAEVRWVRAPRYGVLFAMQVDPARIVAPPSDA